MKAKCFLITVFSLVLVFFCSNAFSDDDDYYARCNLKVLKNTYITWVNWQSAPTFIPVGTKLRIIKTGKNATLINDETGAKYTLDIGSVGDVYLAKFVTKSIINIEKFPEDIQMNIEKALAQAGMTKEQVYIAMGPPGVAGNKTYAMTYEEIMAQDLWVYKRRRFGKNIGVSFNYKTGLVDRTEGIWRQ